MKKTVLAIIGCGRIAINAHFPALAKMENVIGNVLTGLLQDEPKEQFTLLLSHRPERIEDYLGYPFDLILSGHAHGGQWRLPGIVNGLYAPNQGLFPKYAGGRYDFEDTAFLVSRGLARESTKIPRVFNRPELVVVDLIPA